MKTLRQENSVQTGLRSKKNRFENLQKGRLSGFQKISIKRILGGFSILCGLILCLLVLILPMVDWVQNQNLIDTFQSDVLDQSYKQIEHEMKRAKKWNIELSALSFPLNEQKAEEYRSILNYQDGIMGVIDIPSIDVHLPIYHSTSAQVLSHGVGHLETTPFPIGQRGMHSALSAHTGSASGRLFTRLDELETGDLFWVQTADQKMTYQVKKIQVVDPDDLSVLQPQKDQDLISLITCTPYGINSHRLIVTGQRIPNIEEKETVIQSKRGSLTYWLMPLLPLLILVIGLVVITIRIFRKGWWK